MKNFYTSHDSWRSSNNREPDEGAFLDPADPLVGSFVVYPGQGKRHHANERYPREQGKPKYAYAILEHE
jgi:hypothetical protein